MDWDGGFVNDTAIADEPYNAAGKVSVANAEERSNRCLAAVSVSQAMKLTRPEEGLVVSGRKVFHVSIVAKVQEIIDINTTKLNVLLDDGTSGGPLEMNHIFGDSGTPEENPDYSMFKDVRQDETNSRSLHTLKTGDYVRASGAVKFIQDRPMFTAFFVRIVEDPNEVTMHLLEVIRDSMYYRRIQKGDSIGSMAPGLDAGKMGATAGANTFNQHNAKDDFGRLSTREKHLLNFLKEKTSGKGGNEAGLTVDEISEAFKAFSADDITESLNILNGEGLVWPGESEDRWCAS